VSSKARRAARGYRLGFETQSLEVDAPRLMFEGSVPHWLDGRYVHQSAVFHENSAWHAEHWFDGLSMLSAVRFASGQASFANRFLRTTEYAAAMRGEAPFLGAFHLPDRPFLDRVRNPFPPGTDNANISVAQIGGKLVALGETNHQIDVEWNTLETLGYHRYDDEFPPDVALNAHPVIDPMTKDMVAVAVKYPQKEFTFYTIAHGTNTRKAIAKLRTEDLTYVHSFAVSATKIVLLDFPFRATPATLGFNLALGRRGFLESFSWSQGSPTRLVVLDRRTARVTHSNAPPLFGFHVVNAFDDGDDLVVDVAAIDRAPDLRELLYERLRAAPPLEWPTLHRLRIRSSGSTQHERLGQERFDFPAMNEHRRMAAHRYVWGVGPGRNPAEDFSSVLLKKDTLSAVVRRFEQEGLHFGEPCVVPNPIGQAEDDGIVVTIAMDAKAEGSALLLLDAATLNVRARAPLPIRVPYGFHGRFFASA
jgi:beta,beta-carotene 9',10'-dioxygenase